MKKKAKPINAYQPTPEEEAWEMSMREVIDGTEQRLKDLQYWPTVGELAHLAAVLRRGDAKSDANIIAEEALTLWSGCYGHLHHEMTQSVRSYENNIACGPPPEIETPKPPRVRFVNGKADFEAALKALVGEKTRKADRYRIFREFMRDQARKNGSSNDEERVAAVTEKRFNELKEGGFPQESFQKAEAWFVEWRKERRHERAKKAAKQRWKNGDGNAGHITTETGSKETEPA